MHTLHFEQKSKFGVEYPFKQDFPEYLKENWSQNLTQFRMKDYIVKNRIHNIICTNCFSLKRNTSLNLLFWRFFTAGTVGVIYGSAASNAELWRMIWGRFGTIAINTKLVVLWRSARNFFYYERSGAFSVRADVSSRWGTHGIGGGWRWGSSTSMYVRRENR